MTRTLTFMNSTEQIVPVPIIADDRTESVESFTAMLMSPTPSGSAFITTPTATINIIDQQGIYLVLLGSDVTVRYCMYGAEMRPTTGLVLTTSSKCVIEPT